MAIKKVNEDDKINLPDIKTTLTDEERIFIDLFVWGGIDYQGREKECYEKAFGGKKLKSNTRKAKKLIARDDVSMYLSKQHKDFDSTLKVEKYKNIDVLARIRDEMANSYKYDRKGRMVSPASDRTVAIKAIETINKMIGVGEEEEEQSKKKEAGVTFNLIVPEPSKDSDNDVININI